MLSRVFLRITCIFDKSISSESEVVAITFKRSWVEVLLLLLCDSTSDIRTSYKSFKRYLLNFSIFFLDALPSIDFDIGNWEFFDICRKQ